MGFAFTSLAFYTLLQSPHTTTRASGVTITDQFNQKDLYLSEIMREIIARQIDLSSVPAIEAQLLVDKPVLVESTASTRILDYHVRLCISDRRTLTTTIRADDCEFPDQIKEQAVVEFSRELAGQLTARN